MIKVRSGFTVWCYRRFEKALLGLSLFLLLACSERAAEPLVFSGPTMGTSYQVKVLALPENVQPDALADDITRLLADVNQSMSTYISDSEINRLNAEPVSNAFVLSQPLFDVLSMSQDVAEMSDGAFDITVGPLVNLWGFGPGKAQTLPSDADIEKTLRKTGYQALQLNPSGLTAVKTKTLALDLSAIAKGYGVDVIVDYLAALGATDFMVEIGGEVRTRGLSPRGTPWRIGIETPTLRRGVPFSAVQLKDQAIATSGDYRNYIEREGKRFSHTIHPATGRPVTHKLASVTVLHTSCAMADALATALNVLGPEAGLQLAEEHKLAAYFIIRDGDGFTAKASSTFNAQQQVNGS